MNDEWVLIEKNILKEQKKDDRTKYIFKCLNCKHRWTRVIGKHIQAYQEDGHLAIIDYKNMIVRKIFCPKCKTWKNLSIKHKKI